MKHSTAARLCKKLSVLLICLLTAGALLFSESVSNSSPQAMPFKNGERAAQSRDGLVLTSSSRIAERISAIFIYAVSGGKSFEHVLSRQDLEKSTRFTIDGHINGIVAFGGPELTISVDGHQANHVSRNSDGTFTIKNFGTLRPEELMRSGKAYYGANFFTRIVGSRNESTVNAYSYFPVIMGDSVSQKNDFPMAIGFNDRVLNLSFHQKGYRTVCTVDGRHPDKDGTIAFRYVGSRLDSLKQKCPDFEARVAAIREGIELVNASFGVKLIRSVNIIDYERIYDAVTCDAENDMWIYIRTFRKEPLAELKSIATHEALHKYVHLKRFTLDSGVRQLFADLKGYDELSYQRLMLVMQGVAVASGSGKPSPHRLFFPFIDEKNFLQGMKGGHSADNLDEFCTSLLHSLMFSDRLQQNLYRPLKMGGKNRRPHLLTSSERSLMIRDYVRAIQILLGADREPTGSTTLQAFLGKRLQQAETVEKGLVAQSQAPSPTPTLFPGVSTVSQISATPAGWMLKGH